MGDDRNLRFPASFLACWLGIFSAVVALVTLWALPLGMTAKVLATSLFALVPTVIVAFWLGQAFERWMRGRDQPPP